MTVSRAEEDGTMTPMHVSIFAIGTITALCAAFCVLTRRDASVRRAEAGNARTAPDAAVARR